MDEERTKSRTWNGYVCPGCRTVFRVAADFTGTDVMCPSCKETLRLPRNPEDAQAHAALPVKLPDAQAVEAAKPTKPTKPVRSADHHEDHEPSALRLMLSTSDGRIKLLLALLIPVAVVAAVLLVFPPKESTPPAAPEIAAENAPLVRPEIKIPAEPVQVPAPPPPPVAVTELPRPADIAPTVPEEPPTPEIAVTPPPPPAPEIVEPAPQVPVPSPAPAPVEVPVEAPVAAVPDVAPQAAPPAVVEEKLVEAVPAQPEPAPQKPAPAAQPKAAPVPAAQSPELLHTVVRGDTLTKLARRYQVSASVIKKANRMKSDVVMLGQKLKIPGGTAPAAEPAAAPAAVKTPPQPAAPRFHTVVRGDTLERIARKYRVSPQQIMQANGMKNDVVNLGRKLAIPPTAP